MRYCTKTFHIRLTEKEYDRLSKHAERAGVPKTTYIRHMINGCQPKDNPPVDFWEFYKELHAFGNNLNQITSLAHRFGSIHAAKLDEVLKQYNTFSLEVFKQMKLPKKVDIPAALERGQQVAKLDLCEMGECENGL